MNENETTGPAAPSEEASAEQSEAMAAERAGEYLAALQRERADFVNYKRRAEQERTLLGAVATAITVARFLPVLDDFDRAVQAIDPAANDSPWVQGILAVQRKAAGVLDSLGVRELEVEGAPFDPRVCEAVLEGDGPANTVVGVLERGYVMGDQVIRPARVIVGRDGTAVGASEEAPTSAMREDGTEQRASEV